MDNDHAMSLALAESDPATAPAVVYNPPSPSSTQPSPTLEYPIFQLYPEMPDPNAMDVDHSVPESPNQESIGLLGLEALGDKHNKLVLLPYGTLHF